MRSSFCPTFCLQVAISRALASFWRYPYLIDCRTYRSKSFPYFIIWHSDPYKDRLRPSRESTWGVMADKKQFSNTKLFVKVETGIVTHISYHHYLKNVGNNKLWPHMQKESWNIHGTKILICSITLNGTESQPSPSTSGLRVTLSYLRVRIAQS